MQKKLVLWGSSVAERVPGTWGKNKENAKKAAGKMVKQDVPTALAGTAHVGVHRPNAGFPFLLVACYVVCTKKNAVS